MTSVGRNLQLSVGGGVCMSLREMLSHIGIHQEVETEEWTAN